MKIQRLTIHNIASIEDAVIEFDKEPLAAEPLFLITGETGSGKTTILNAICLALYNTAPNLRQIGSSEEDAEGIQTNNPRQLMRRGTAEAFVSLTFEGNDEKQYEATWSVRRARNKADGALQTVKRTLLCRDTDTSLQKETEIRQAIQNAVGLTFEQFCRTTMLAQGQFAKFMNSEEKDKAEILEKLTGTEIYTRIGKKIFELSKAKNLEFEHLNSEIQGAQLLTEETKAAYHKEIEQLSQRSMECSTLTQTADNRLRWLTEFQNKQKALELGRQSLQALLTQNESDAICRKRTLLRQWEATTEIRNLLKIKAKEEKEIADRQKQLAEQNDRFKELTAGANALHDQLQQIRQTIKLLWEQQEAEQPHAAMYASAERIAGYIQILNEKTKHLQQYRQALAQSRQRLRLLDEETGLLREKCQKSEHTYDEQKQNVEALRRATTHIDLQTLADTVSKGKEKINRLMQAISAITAYREKAADYTHEEKTLRDTELQIDIRKKQATSGEQQLATARLELTAIDNQYKGKQDLVDHITELQIRFQDTHTCPLCGTHIDKLHTDTLLNEALQEAKTQRDRAQKEFDTLQQEVAQTKASIAQLLTNHRLTREKLLRQKAVLDQAARQAMEQTAPFSIDYKSADAFPALEAELKEAIRRNQVDEETQRQANLQKETLGKAEQLLASCRTQADNAQKQYREQQEQINSLNTLAAHQKGVTEQTEQDIHATRTELDKLLSFKVDWQQTDPRSLSSDIQKRARHYAATRDKLATLALRETSLVHEAATADDIIDTLRPLFPEADSSTSREIPRVEQALRNFSNDINLLQGAIRQAQNNLHKTTDDIRRYFLTHPEFTEEQIGRLNQSSDNDIERYRLELEQLRTAIQQSEGAARQLTAQLEEHSKNRPEMPADATVESLSEEKRGMDLAQKQADEAKIALQTKLQDDAVRLENVLHKKEQLEQLRHEKDNWYQLEYHFGGAQGDKFKKIAQSYVLRSLLQKANYYLKMLSNRYELECTDGSLTINVTDHHQGDAVRNVGLLSGGEGFIVSLALALGLSAISKDKINVDTLFIDEGFGTLSNDYLEIVISTLDHLHQFGGRRVGIISHVAELATRIRTQIRLKRTGPGSSKVIVTSD